MYKSTFFTTQRLDTVSICTFSEEICLSLPKSYAIRNKGRDMIDILTVDLAS